ncbi:MAG: MBL fold metallo-hydrolase [Clostridiales bacterium]|nr:MBL fold metallo-hydrolase [Clostridiales bacterium]
MGYSEINYLVATHPHSDHIGGFTEVLAEFDVDNIYLPDAVSSSDIYSEFLKSAEAEDCNVLKAESGVEIINENNLTAEFLAPVSSEYDELNNYSAVLKITYENNSFIFMGDAEALSEKEITADVSADVIKVGHHGSNTSSCENFVNRVSAEYAVIECGSGNSYGHPNEDVVSRWENSGALVMTTMDCGNILISSNGSEINALCTNENEIQSSVSQNAAQSAENEWVINVKTKKCTQPIARMQVKSPRKIKSIQISLYRN